MFYFYKFVFFLLCCVLVNGNSNIKIGNIKGKNIFTIKENSYLIKKINIEFINKNIDDKFISDNIYNILTFKENEYINLKNSTISTNISRIKKVFKFINNVTFEGDLDTNNNLTITLKIENFEKIKNINAIGQKINKKKIEKIQNKYKNKFLTNKIVEDIKGKVKNICKTFTILKIKTYENKEHSYFINDKKSQKKYFVDNVNIVGNKNVNTQDIIKHLTIKGAKYYSLSANLIPLIKNSKINNINLFKLLDTLKSNFLITNNISFNKKTLNSDKKKIINLYLSKGFLDAKIDKIDLELDNTKRNLNITYNIDEGKQYFFGDIEFVGNNNVTSEILMKIINIKKGDPFNYIYLKNNISDSNSFNLENNIKNYYNMLGYLKSNITFKIKSINNDTINVVININEGEKVIINKIVVSGNKYVNSTEFYKSSLLFPGDTYNHSKYIATQQNILRNEFLNPKKSFVTLDNDNNINIIVEEKIGIEPILNISTQQINEDYCCSCCKCCKIGPAINIGCKLTNLNFKKLLHLKDNRYSFLGAGDVVKIQITYSPLDAKINAELSGTIRKINKNLGAGTYFRYSRHKGDIDNKSNDFNENRNKYSKNEKSMCCSSLIHDISFSNTIIFSNLNNTIVNVLKPIQLNIKIGKNFLKIYKCYLDINIHNELKFSTISNNFWNNNGIEALISILITNPFLFISKNNNTKKLKINKYCEILTYFTYFKSLYKNLVLNATINLGYNKSFNKYRNSFKIDKEDREYFSHTNNNNISYLYLNGINENSTLLNLINKCQCNLAFKLNTELRYLFLNSNIVNMYIFLFFNGGNLFIPENEYKYREFKQYNKSQLYNPIRFYSTGIGIRFEPEILKFLIPNLYFSLYYDLRNRNLSFNIVK